MLADLATQLQGLRDSLSAQQVLAGHPSEEYKVYLRANPRPYMDLSPEEIASRVRAILPVLSEAAEGFIKFMIDMDLIDRRYVLRQGQWWTLPQGLVLFADDPRTLDLYKLRIPWHVVESRDIEAVQALAYERQR
jgi:hypothetical protein